MKLFHWFLWDSFSNYSQGCITDCSRIISRYYPEIPLLIFRGFFFSGIASKISSGIPPGSFVDFFHAPFIGLSRDSFMDSFTDFPKISSEMPSEIPPYISPGIYSSIVSGISIEPYVDFFRIVPVFLWNSSPDSWNYSIKHPLRYYSWDSLTDFSQVFFRDPSLDFSWNCSRFFFHLFRNFFRGLSRDFYIIFFLGILSKISILSGILPGYSKALVLRFFRKIPPDFWGFLQGILLGTLNGFLSEFLPGFLNSFLHWFLKEFLPAFFQYSSRALGFGTELFQGFLPRISGNPTEVLSSGIFFGIPPWISSLGFSRDSFRDSWVYLRDFSRFLLKTPVGIFSGITPALLRGYS